MSDASVLRQPVQRIGGFELDHARKELRRAGRVVALRPKTFLLLEMLARRAGSVVSAAELRAGLWADAAVTAQSLFSLVNELRKVLTSSVPEDELLKVVRGRGYLLEAEPLFADEAAVGAPAMPPLPGLHPHFVGRGEQLRLLESAWDRAALGAPRAVFVAGEPGAGKTTLVRQLVARQAAKGSPFQFARGNCFERHVVREPYAPFVDIIESLAWSNEQRQILFREAPVWAGLLDVNRVLPSGPLSSFDAQPESLLRQARGFLDVLAASRPLVLLLDDLQWADLHTLELIGFLLRKHRQSHLLLLATYRDRESLQRGTPVERMAHELREYADHIQLPPLPRNEICSLVRSFEADVSAQVVDDVAACAGGNPLLAEALARQSARSGLAAPSIDAAPASGDERSLPPPVWQVVEAQWQLVDVAARQAIEAGAVVGTGFDVATVALMLGRPLLDVAEDLGRHAALPYFVEASLAPIRGGMARSGRYSFRHQLYRDFVYNKIPPDRGAVLHAAAGRALTELAGENAAAQAGKIAEHFIAGGDPAGACEHLERAAHAMVERGAVEDASAILELAIDCTAQMPLAVDRDRQQLRLLTQLGLARAWLHGPNEPRLIAAFDQGKSLLERVSDEGTVATALRCQWLWNLVRFDFKGMLAVAEQATSLARRSRSSTLTRQANCLAGATLCFLGRQKEAATHLGSALRGLPRQPIAIGGWGLDFEVELRCYVAWCGMLRGRVAESERQLLMARRRARRLGHPTTQLLALWFEASLAQLAGKRQRLEQRAAELLDLAARQPATTWKMIAETVAATVRLEGGDSSDMEILLQSLDPGEGQATVLIARAYLLGQLALAFGRSGRAPQGLALVQIALQRIEDNGARVSESEFHRIAGELHATLGDVPAAAAAYQKALSVAQEQGAHLLETRARACLCQLAGRSGRGAGSTTG